MDFSVAIMVSISFYGPSPLSRAAVVWALTLLDTTVWGNMQQTLAARTQESLRSSRSTQRSADSRDRWDSCPLPWRQKSSLRCTAMSTTSGEAIGSGVSVCFRKWQTKKKKISIRNILINIWCKTLQMWRVRRQRQNLWFRSTEAPGRSGVWRCRWLNQSRSAGVDRCKGTHFSLHVLNY